VDYSLCKLLSKLNRSLKANDDLNRLYLLFFLFVIPINLFLVLMLFKYNSLAIELLIIINYRLFQDFIDLKFT